MRRLAILAFCSLVSLPSGAQSRGPAAGDEAAIREVVRKYVDAREKRDPVLIAALFTEDADQVTTAGEWRRGRDNVVKGDWPRRRAIRARATSRSRPCGFLAPGVAIADGRYEIRDAPDSAPRRMWTTFVLMKDGRALARRRDPEHGPDRPRAAEAFRTVASAAGPSTRCGSLGTGPLTRIGEKSVSRRRRSRGRYHLAPMISSKPAIAAMAGLAMWGATVVAQGTPPPGAPPQGPPPQGRTPGGGRGGPQPPKNLQVLKDVPPDQLQLTMHTSPRRWA